MSAPDSLKSSLFAFFANLSIAIAKRFATLYTCSSAMLAETLPSIAIEIKARVWWKESDLEPIEAINRTEADFRNQFGSLRWLFFEPGLAA